MMILDIYKDSIEYSAQDFKTIIILGIITLLSFLILPILIILGYNYEIYEIAIYGIINNKDPLPENRDVDLLTKGLKIATVKIVYYIIPALIFLIFTYLAGISYSEYFIVGFILTVITGYFSYIYSQFASINMVKNRSVKSAFDFEKINKIINEIGVLKVFSTYFGLLIINTALILVSTFIIAAIFIIFQILIFLIGIDLNSLTVIPITVNMLIIILLILPFNNIFNSRAGGLLYTLGE